MKRTLMTRPIPRPIQPYILCYIIPDYTILLHSIKILTVMHGTNISFSSICYFQSMFFWKSNQNRTFSSRYFTYFILGGRLISDCCKLAVVCQLQMCNKQIYMYRLLHLNPVPQSKLTTKPIHYFYTWTH